MSTRMRTLAFKPRGSRGCAMRPCLISSILFFHEVNKTNVWTSASRGLEALWKSFSKNRAAFLTCG